MERSKGDWQWTRAAIVAVCVWMLGLPCGGRFDGSAGALEQPGSVPPWVNPTPQRMCVGMIKGRALVGFEPTRQISRIDGEEYNALSWYQGDLGSGGISPWKVEASTIAERGSTTLRRWCWEEGRLWFGFEALYGSSGPNSAMLWRTKPLAEIDGAALSPDEPDDAEPHPDQKVVTETCIPGNRPFNAIEEVERLSLLKPLMRSVDPIHAEWHRDRDLGLFDHGNGGFDLIPHSLDDWTLFMSVRHTMQVWDCRSRRSATEKGDEIRNTWTLVTELWIPWQGQFFVLERFPHCEYILVRDCGEVYLLELEMDTRTDKPALNQGTVWRGRQLLDPADYLIALLYIEPDNTVYGFGPNFYVRLATGETLESPTSSHEKKPCRDVTQGKAVWTDENGESHELGEPFRTIWQCANVLKEDGVLDREAGEGHGANTDEGGADFR